MREWCECGAGVRSWSYKRVLDWRKNHFHPGPQEPEEPRMNGSHAMAQHAGPRYFESESRYGQDVPIVNAQVGFVGDYG